MKTVNAVKTVKTKQILDIRNVLEVILDVLLLANQLYATRTINIQ